MCFTVLPGVPELEGLKGVPRGLEKFLGVSGEGV